MIKLFEKIADYKFILTENHNRENGSNISFLFCFNSLSI